jgi:large subunit ribosomal protein L27Ae
LWQLWSLLPQEIQDKYLGENSSAQDTAPVIDLLALGYAKVLGKGRLPNVPVVIKARYVSKEAERKITEIGGRIELVA